jgi:hypothetical protein
MRANKPRKLNRSTIIFVVFRPRPRPRVYCTAKTNRRAPPHSTDVPPGSSPTLAPQAPPRRYILPSGTKPKPSSTRLNSPVASPSCALTQSNGRRNRGTYRTYPLPIHSPNRAPIGSERESYKIVASDTERSRQNRTVSHVDLRHAFCMESGTLVSLLIWFFIG